MGEAENIERVMRFYRAGPADRDEQREQFFAADAVWHVPGANQVSGDYKGVEQIAGEIGRRMQPLERWSLEPRHVMANRDMVVSILHIDGERRGHTLRGHGAHVFRFNEAGLIVEAWGFIEDQAAADAMFDA
jgi:ketosteroid isomerase-like protein